MWNQHTGYGRGPPRQLRSHRDSPQYSQPNTGRQTYHQPSYNSPANQYHTSNTRSHWNDGRPGGRRRNPSPNRQRESNAPNRQRSRSPNRQPEGKATKRQRSPPPHERSEQAKKQKVCDENDQNHDRKEEQQPKAIPDIESNLAKQQVKSTALTTKTQKIVDEVDGWKLGPGDIDAGVLESMPEKIAWMIARTLNVLGAPTFGVLHDVRYKDYEDAATLTEYLYPGVVIFCPIGERMMDNGIPSDNLDLNNGLHGKWIVKDRTCLITNTHERTRKIEVRPCYGFHGNGLPEYLKQDFVRLIHWGESRAYRDQKGCPLFHYTGTHHLTKPSYFSLEEPMWISVEKMPCSIMGWLNTDEHESLGDLMGLGKRHPFVLEGQKPRRTRP